MKDNKYKIIALGVNTDTKFFNSLLVLKQWCTHTEFEYETVHVTHENLDELTDRFSITSLPFFILIDTKLGVEVTSIEGNLNTRKLNAMLNFI